jgi:hypothetical protein
VQAPEIEDEPRRDAEIDEIGKRIEFGAEARRALEDTRDAAVETVKNGGGDNGVDRVFEAAFDGETDRRQPERQREQRDQIR